MTATRTTEKVRGYEVTLELGDDGWYVAEVADLPGCVSQGRTRDETLRNVGEAIDLCIDEDGGA